MFFSHLLQCLNPLFWWWWKQFPWLYYLQFLYLLVQETRRTCGSDSHLNKHYWCLILFCSSLSFSSETNALFTVSSLLTTAAFFFCLAATEAETVGTAHGLCPVGGGSGGGRDGAQGGGGGGGGGQCLTTLLTLLLQFTFSTSARGSWASSSSTLKLCPVFSAALKGFLKVQWLCVLCLLLTRRLGRMRLDFLLRMKVAVEMMTVTKTMRIMTPARTPRICKGLFLFCIKNGPKGPFLTWVCKRAQGEFRWMGLNVCQTNII